MCALHRAGFGCAHNDIYQPYRYVRGSGRRYAAAAADTNRSGRDRLGTDNARVIYYPRLHAAAATLFRGIYVVYIIIMYTVVGCPETKIIQTGARASTTNIMSYKYE